MDHDYEERERTGVLKTIKGTSQYDLSFKIEGWWGLCHAWAPATVLYKNQLHYFESSGYQDSFGASDIKVLSLHMHTVPERSQHTFLGERCFTDLEGGFCNGKKFGMTIFRQGSDERFRVDKKSTDNELKGLRVQ